MDEIYDLIEFREREILLCFIKEYHLRQLKGICNVMINVIYVEIFEKQIFVTFLS